MEGGAAASALLLVPASVVTQLLSSDPPSVGVSSRTGAAVPTGRPQKRSPPDKAQPYQVRREGLALAVPKGVHKDLVVLDGDGAHRGVC